MQPQVPFIPENITVHLGAPDDNAKNVTIPFSEYIMNVASGEINPTWPESALYANIYAIVTLALNRIMTGHYRSRGYGFDITSLPEYDQKYTRGREIYCNVRKIAGTIFNSCLIKNGDTIPPETRIERQGERIPGALSQSGSIELGKKGYTPLEILKHYFGDNISIIKDIPVENCPSPRMSFPIMFGSRGRDIREFQVILNRISDNYTSIPKIAKINGVFGTDTTDALKEFQRIFGMSEDGVLTRAVWCTLMHAYSAIKKLERVNCERKEIGRGAHDIGGRLVYGDIGRGVLVLQHIINYLSRYHNTLPSTDRDGVFGEDTLAAVIDLQKTLGLEPDGIVGENTWKALYAAYLGAVLNTPDEYANSTAIPFGGENLDAGSDSDYVAILQAYLDYISGTYPEVPPISVTGFFGNNTRESVLAAQSLLGLESTGVVDRETWNAISELYTDLYYGSRRHDGQFPGYSIGKE